MVLYAIVSGAYWHHTCAHHFDLPPGLTTTVLRHRSDTATKLSPLRTVILVFCSQPSLSAVSYHHLLLLVPKHCTQTEMARRSFSQRSGDMFSTSIRPSDVLSDAIRDDEKVTCMYTNIPYVYDLPQISAFITNFIVLNNNPFNLKVQSLDSSNYGRGNQCGHLLLCP